MRTDRDRISELSAILGVCTPEEIAFALAQHHEVVAKPLKSGKTLVRVKLDPAIAARTSERSAIGRPRHHKRTDTSDPHGLRRSITREES